MTKKEAIHFLYQIADEIQSFLDKTSSPKGQWTSHKRLEALSMAISALYDLFQAEEDGRLIIPPCKVGDTVWVITGTAASGGGTEMNFKQFIRWRLVCFVQTHIRHCQECLGSNGHCQECNDWHHLFRRDWQRTYWRRKF